MSAPAITLLEMIIALTIITIIFAAVLPQFRVIRNSWDSKQANAEVIQNGRVLMDHINRNLSKAVQITSVSEFSDANGYIEYKDNDGNTLRYDIAANSYVEFGPPGSLSDLAGPVSSLTFTCYDACNLDTPLDPITDANLIRSVKVETTLTNSASPGQNRSFTIQTYLRTNANTGGLVGRWKLDETSGLTAADSSRSSRDGTLSNMAGSEWTTGQINGALAFDGTNDYVDCGNAASLDITDAVTLSAWVKTNDAGNDEYNYFVGKGDTAYAIQHQYTNQIEFFIYDDGAWYSTWYGYGIIDESFNDVWHHLAGTYDGSQLKLYIDGVLQDTKEHTGSINSNAYNVNIGDNSEYADSFYNGVIDDVRIYNRALNAEEIAALANILTYREFTEAKAGSDTMSIAISTPATNTGDLLIAAVATDGDTSASLAAPAGQGWTLINCGAYSNAVTLGAWWKIAGGSEPANYTFTWSGAQQAYGWMMRFTGYNATNPINGTPTATNSTSATPTSPAVTTTVNGCLILRLGAFDDDDIVVDSPGLSGHTAITMDKSSGELVGRWKLDETSGLTAADSSRSGRNGTLTNMAGDEWTTGRINGALAFDGTNDYVSVSSLNNKFTNNDTFTVTGWFKTSKTTGIQTIVGQWMQLNPSHYVNVYLGWQVLVEGNVVVARFGNGTSPTGITGTTTVTNGAWHHFALVYPTSSSNSELYVDGVSEGTPGNHSFSGGVFRIGDGSYVITGSPILKGGPFNGIIDDVRLYNRALSDEEIATLADGGGSEPVSGGAGYVRQSASGDSGTSTFSIGSSNEARTLTIAIAPADNSGCDDDSMRP